LLSILYKFVVMEKRNEKNKKQVPLQLDLFHHSENSKTDFKVAPIDKSSSCYNGIVVQMSGYPAKNQINKFYETVEKLTKHLD
jgi:hypothetical protein